MALRAIGAHWSDADLLVPGQFALRVSDVVIVHETQTLEFESLVEHERDAGFVGHVLDGLRQFVRRDGSVYGDSTSRTSHQNEHPLLGSHPQDGECGATPPAPEPLNGPTQGPGHSRT